MANADDQFYLRYYVGHRGKFGHEYLEFEIKNGTLTYANNSNYKTDQVTKADDIIARKVQVGAGVVEELKKIVLDSEILKEDDHTWPAADRVGRQELEVVIGGDHIFFNCTKLGSVLQVQQSKDPEGLRIFYYLVQDLKCFVFSLIAAHFKIQPIQR